MRISSIKQTLFCINNEKRIPPCNCTLDNLLMILTSKRLAMTLWMYVCAFMHYLYFLRWSERCKLCMPEILFGWYLDDFLLHHIARRGDFYSMHIHCQSQGYFSNQAHQHAREKYVNFFGINENFLLVGWAIKMSISKYKNETIKY